MQIKEFGEFNLIEEMRLKFGENLPGGVFCGIGDDCAVVENGDNFQLITTDMLVENVHFLKESIKPEELGYKSLAVSLSDIASMGGDPLYAFLSLGLPKNTDKNWIDCFLSGFKQLADDSGVSLIGGDTVGSLNDIIVNVCLLGVVPKENIKMRSNALARDVVCVIENLGDSGAGCKILLEKKEQIGDDIGYLIQTHNRPKMHLKEGKWFGGRKDVHAMIDLSDGIASDLKRISESASVGFNIDLDSLPLSDSLKRVCKNFNWDPLELASTGGEDYSLLLTVDPKEYANLKMDYERQFGSSLYKIGTVVEKGINYFKNGQKVEPNWFGFDHFV